MLYTSLDFHRSFTYVTTMDEKGEILGQKKLPSNGEIVDFLKEFEDSMEVAIESTPRTQGGLLLPRSTKYLYITS